MFIVIEGGDGVGKTTVANELVRELNGVRPTIYVREPGSEHVSDDIRRLIGFELTRPLTRQFLFQAARAQTVENVIRPALEDRQVVICDRYIYSTLVYQTIEAEIPEHAIATMNNIATRGLAPDLIFLLDAPIEVTLDRIEKDRREKDGDTLSVYDEREHEFHQAIRDGYLNLVKRNYHGNKLWRTIDATQPLRQVVLGCLAHIMLHEAFVNGS